MPRRCARQRPGHGAACRGLHAIDYSPAGDGAPPDRAGGRRRSCRRRASRRCCGRRRRSRGGDAAIGPSAASSDALAFRPDANLSACGGFVRPPAARDDCLPQEILSSSAADPTTHRDIPLTVLVWRLSAKAKRFIVLEDRRTAGRAPLLSGGRRRSGSCCPRSAALPAGCAARSGNLATFPLDRGFLSAQAAAAAGFLRHLEGLRSVACRQTAACGGVRLMTVHDSKGTGIPDHSVQELSTTTRTPAPMAPDPCAGLGSKLL